MYYLKFCNPKGATLNIACREYSTRPSPTEGESGIIIDIPDSTEGKPGVHHGIVRCDDWIDDGYGYTWTVLYVMNAQGETIDKLEA